MAKPDILTLLPAVFATTAFFCSLYGGMWCKFLQFQSSSPSNSNDITLHFGIWYYQGWSIVDTSSQGLVVLESCHDYPEYMTVDTNWKAARAFSIISLVLGGIVLIFGLCTGCIRPNNNSGSGDIGKFAALSYLICCFSQGMSLLLLDSNACNNNVMVGEVEKAYPNLDFGESCDMSSGAKSVISASVFWFAACLAALRSPSLGEEERRVDGDDEMDPSRITEPLL
mmetsp:Transcript_315/g.642  ORF Transcript_315/g.642 Transcript_315/m.642 type:complete len:226 (-) Transcript_315:193-870(-)